MNLEEFWTALREAPEEAIAWIILGWAFSMVLHAPPLFRLFR
jgi:hypothetical protein